MTKLTKIEQNIQAILFAAGEPYEKERLAKLLEIDRQTLEQLVERINEWYEDTPFILLELDQCYQMATRAEYAQVHRQALEVKNNTPLSQAALEVLAIIAYNQPVTKSFIEQIRGVDSSSVVNALVAKELVQEMGRLEIPGRPISYGTTEPFSALLWDEEHRNAAQAAAEHTERPGGRAGIEQRRRRVQR